LTWPTAKLTAILYEIMTDRKIKLTVRQRKEAGEALRLATDSIAI
jgi:hypothetical protein